MFRFFVGTLIVAVASATDIQRRIIGGETATLGQFPYLVSLRLYDEHICGGSIIRSNWILTSASCLEEPTSASILMVWVGAQSLTEGGRAYGVSEIISHEDYDSSTIRNDIGLVRTEEEIEFNDNVQPIKYDGDYIDGGRQAVVSGWGDTQFSIIAEPDELQFQRTETLSNEDCRAQVPPDVSEIVLDSNICAHWGDAGHGACIGDGGDPLAVDDVLAGVVSWVIPCGVGYPDGYTRVSAFAQWINANLQ